MNDHELIGILEDYSLCGYEALKAHIALAFSCSEVEGDIVECGVLNGGSAASLAHGLPGRRVWLYDSFLGMPEPGANDPPETHRDMGNPCLVGTIERVKQAMSIVGADDYIIREGWFDDTFSLPLPEKVAVLHVDCDWYESVALTLETFYPFVQPGGVIILDDWAWWDGCRKAFYDWAARTGEKPLLFSFGKCQSYWRKGEEHIRGY